MLDFMKYSCKTKALNAGYIDPSLSGEINTGNGPNILSCYEEPLFASSSRFFSRASCSSSKRRFSSTATYSSGLSFLIGTTLLITSSILSEKDRGFKGSEGSRATRCEEGTLRRWSSENGLFEGWGAVIGASDDVDDIGEGDEGLEGIWSMGRAETSFAPRYRIRASLSSFVPY